MLMRLRCCFAVAAVVILVTTLGAGPVLAQSLTELRASGALGERFDGYAVARQSSAAAAVKEVNAKRKKIYGTRAAAQSVPTAQVGRVYAKQIFDKAAPGAWFLKENGAWVQKK